MDQCRSKSYGGGGGKMQIQIEPYYGPTGDFCRSYSSVSSTNYYYYEEAAPPKLRKGRRQLRGGDTGVLGWRSVNDPEFQRKRRVASYKAYSVQGKLKGSFRRSFRWLKDRYTQVVYGCW
ncbi:uncharacterized protein LOC127255471 [Andrographis paniculata]|uniref:uncharacterized protein LOC127255471 n=1 Tax=Andrographis paniculata TaxID=175694 RepID=UPI0021E6FA74|nr:uncharacterized protein LOC127255471 [Andrographis paniculata]